MKNLLNKLFSKFFKKQNNEEINVVPESILEIESTPEVEFVPETIEKSISCKCNCGNEECKCDINCSCNDCGCKCDSSCACKKKKKPAAKKKPAVKQPIKKPAKKFVVIKKKR
jgi:hypothetical protein